MSNRLFQSPIRCCLPEEEFFLVWDHEIEEMHRYRGFALCFLPNHPSISRLMVALGIECEERLESLVASAEDLGLGEKLRNRSISPELQAELRRQHFFVVDDDIARLTLAQVLVAACNSWQFYRLMLDSCSTHELCVILRKFVLQKDNAYRVLEEVQESLG
ncbi:MAG: hypothetical protein U5L98_00775 [Halomonas sp.]|uniref:hypothetical protein n=1 Tax=Halomonas sp. TaxID=1486246 RepID=UPI002ACD618D|nr:hypothetical protein [Halomonas sp.]MDZ7851205.1 hypothetical protein [Halomonas sp.]